MRTLAEGVADHARAGLAGADFQKQANAITPGVFDGAGEIDGMHGLAENGISASFAARGVGLTIGEAVEGHAFRWRGIEQVQITVGLRYRGDDIAMHGGHAPQWQKMGV